MLHITKYKKLNANEELTKLEAITKQNKKERIERKLNICSRFQQRVTKFP